MLGKKWKPSYLSGSEQTTVPKLKMDAKEQKKKPKQKQELSTKGGCFITN